MKRLSYLLLLSLSIMVFVGCSEKKKSFLRDDVLVSTEISNHRILDIAQDSCGYIWLGTYRGLSRYDGNEMHQYFCTEEEGSLPDNMIRTLLCDHTGRLWVGTKNGVCVYNDKDQFDSVPLPASANPLAMDFAESKRGDLYLLLPDQILRYDSIKACFSEFITNLPFAGYSGSKIFIDPEDNIWLIDNKGVTCFSTVTKRNLEKLDFSTKSIVTSSLQDNLLWLTIQGQGLRVYDIIKHEWVDETYLTPDVAKTLSNTYVQSISAIPNMQKMLIGTDCGMFEYNLKDHRLIHQDNTEFPFKAPDFIVSGIFFDRNRNVWLASGSQGFEVRGASDRTFNGDELLNRQITNSPVTSLCLQNNRRLWISTLREGIYNYDLQTKQLQHFPFSELKKYLPDANSYPYYMMVDSKDQLWVSCAPGHILCLRPEGNSFHTVARYSVPFAIVIQEARDHTIWVGTYMNSYFTINPEDGTSEEHHFPNGEPSFIANLQVLKDGRMAALSKGFGLWLISEGSKSLGKQVISEELLSKNLVHGTFIPTSLLQDHQGNLWFGTMSNGVLKYDMTSGKLERFENAPCEDIASIEEDQQGNIWVSTQNGLGMLDVKSNTFINYYKGDGLNGNEFYDRCSVRLPDGRLVFGGEHGLTIFLPKDLRYKMSPSLRLEDLRVNNQLVCPSDDSPIEACLEKASKIRLKHNQNNFSISYSSQDYAQDLRFSYQYRLEGLSDKWVDAKQSHDAFFSNVPAGHYTFTVRVMSQDHQHVLAERSIPVVISPSPWLSWWALLIYLLIIVAIGAHLIRTYRSIREEKQIRLQTEKDREQEKRVNKMNMSFFANVSHEFRTPLTLISGPVNQLIGDTSVPPEARNILTVVQRSVNRMLRLVNQMMDFHKLEDDALRLEVQNTDAVRLIAGIVESFQLQAHEKHLTLTSTGLEEPLTSWIDTDKLEKIIYNLLGNAVKYTPSQGHIELAFDVVGKDVAATSFPLDGDDLATRYIQISVSDDGPGIPEDGLSKVFERYYQLDRQHNGSFNWGTGIGLYYCHRLVKLHHGYIKASNRVGETTGAIFTLLLPMGEEVYCNDTHIDSSQPNQQMLYPISEENLLSPDDSLFQDENEEDSSKPTIVVVDDNEDIVHYLKLLLQTKYNVIGCYDANRALDAVNENAPDLVISDVVMPEKDGYSLCREIKNSMSICHIPVVLVTAKTTTSDQIEGLDCGADAYVSKPFDPNYLLTLISSILSNRQKVRQLLSQTTQIDTIEENVLNAQDNAFMTELYSIMEKELSNPEIDINHITDIMHVSRTKLYYKIKGLTGEKPGNFFRMYKLNRAAELIREGNYNVSEISDMTGFSSPSYFSTCFKKQFGVSPREYNG